MLPAAEVAAALVGAMGQTVLVVVAALTAVMVTQLYLIQVAVGAALLLRLEAALIPAATVALG
jgi:hypothetical protein